MIELFLPWCDMWWSTKRLNFVSENQNHRCSVKIMSLSFTIAIYHFNSSWQVTVDLKWSIRLSCAYDKVTRHTVIWYFIDRLYNWLWSALILFMKTNSVYCYVVIFSSNKSTWLRVLLIYCLPREHLYHLDVFLWISFHDISL
jgi:hypothetical protein